MRDDPGMARELAAVDAALAGEAVEPDLADLAELTRLLRDERPAPAAAFARGLDERARRGFPRGAGPTPRGAGRLRAGLGGHRTPLALGAVASVLVVAALGIAAARHTDDGTRSTAAKGAPRAADTGAAAGASGTATAESDSATGAGAPTDGSTAQSHAGARSSPSTAASGSASDAVASPAPAFVPQGGGSARTDSRARRYVERSAALTLGAKPAELDDVADAVVRVTDAVGGFVATSSVTSGREASFALRIPSAQLPRALRDLSGLAHVRERTQATQDITTVVVSARDRLEDARAERRSLLRRLARATTDAQATALRARLRTVSRQLAQAKASLARAENRARYAGVAVEIVADRSAGPAHGGGAWTPGDALRDAARILEVAAGVALVAAAVLVPLGLVAALAWLAGRRAVRRRRETALDAL